MSPEVAVALLVATLTAMGSTICLLVTFDCQEEALGLEYREIEDPEWDTTAWEWRLRMASLPEAYWY